MAAMLHEKARHEAGPYGDVARRISDGLLGALIVVGSVGRYSGAGAHPNFWGVTASGCASGLSL